METNIVLDMQLLRHEIEVVDTKMDYRDLYALHHILEDLEELLQKAGYEIMVDSEN